MQQYYVQKTLSLYRVVVFQDGLEVHNRLYPGFTPEEAMDECRKKFEGDLQFQSDYPLDFFVLINDKKDG